MNRLLAIVLVPLFVVGNSFAHSHCDMANQSSSQSRAHIHVGGGGHHRHDVHGSHEHSHHDHQHDADNEGDGRDSIPVGLFEHDSDAIYFVAADSLFTTSKFITVDLSLQFALDAATTLNSVATCSPRVHELPRLRTSEAPLYVLHAALRI
jgi:hypothetical protein